MKIYFAHSKKFDYKNDLYRPIRNSQLNEHHEIIFPHENSEEVALPSKDTIKTCDLFVAEVSFPATGLGIELGWADAFGIPIVCVYKKGSKISGSLKVICKNFAEYDACNDLIHKLESILTT